MTVEHIGFDEPCVIRLVSRPRKLKTDIAVLCVRHEVSSRDLDMMIDIILSGEHAAKKILKGARCKVNMRYMGENS